MQGTFPYIPLLTMMQSVSAGFAMSNVITKVGFYGEAPKTGVIKKLSVGIASVTTVQPFRFAISATDVNGFPTGTPIYSAVINTVTANSRITADLLSDYPITKGDRVTAWLEWIDTAGAFTVRHFTTTFNGTPYPTAVNYQNSSWNAGTTAPSWALGYSDDTWPFMYCSPLDLLNTIAVGPVSTYNQLGNRFTAQHDARFCGAAVRANFGNNNIFKITLYDGSGNVLSQSQEYGRKSTGVCIITMPEYTLKKGKAYRLMVTAISGAPGTCNYHDVAPELWDAIGLDNSWQFVRVASANNSFSDFTSSALFCIFPMYNGFGSGGGGLSGNNWRDK